MFAAAAAHAARPCAHATVQLLVQSRAEDRAPLVAGALAAAAATLSHASHVAACVCAEQPAHASAAAEAQRELEFFLSQCEAYGLLPVRRLCRRRALHRASGAHAALRTLFASQAELRAARERTGPTDPTTLRAEKIARFKADKQARAAAAARECRTRGFCGAAACMC